MTKTPLIKIMTIVCLIIGAIMGIIALIPFLSFWILLLLMLAIAPFIIIYFKNLKLIGNIDIEQGMFYGGISGFIAFIGFSLTFFPIAFIIDLIFKTQTFLWVSIVFKNFIFLPAIVIFTALLSAILNMFSGFITVYIYQYIKK